MPTICRICGNPTNNRTHVSYEMMFGSREPFDYFECGECGCLQIAEIPEDLISYYASDYYSLRPSSYSREHSLIRYLRRRRSSYCLHGKNALWPMRSKKYGAFRWFKKTKVSFDSAILDVGCGNGKLIHRMHRDGFNNLMGADPFIAEDIPIATGCYVAKRDIFRVEGAFDLVMLHHSFEHMAQPLRVLENLRELVKPMGYALIRIPVAGSFAWRHYGANWYQLDAPRHLYLHTIKSMRMLADKAGFEVVDVEFDSTESQFLNSELYVRNLSLKHRKDNLFPRREIERYRAKAIELNRLGQGDQACFYLRRR